MALAKLDHERAAGARLQFQLLGDKKCQQSPQDDGGFGKTDGRRSAEDLFHRVQSLELMFCDSTVLLEDLQCCPCQVFIRIEEKTIL